MEEKELRNGMREITLNHQDIENLMSEVRRAIASGDGELLEKILMWKKEKMFLGTWGMDGITLKWILLNLETGKTILEFGSGEGTTKVLSEHFNMISIEEDEKYVGRYKSHYIHVPLKDGWYDREILKTELVGIDYDMIIIDGPAHGERKKFLENLDLFDLDKIIVCDDLGAPSTTEMWNTLAPIVQKKYDRNFYLLPGTKTGIIC